MTNNLIIFRFLVQFTTDDSNGGDFPGFRMYFRTSTPPTDPPVTTTTEGVPTEPGPSTTTTATTTAPQPPTTEPSNDCGLPAIQPVGRGERILNGEEVVPHSFPWQVTDTEIAQA